MRYERLTPGERLRRLMKEQRRRQYKVAEKVGIHGVTLSRIVTDRVEPGDDIKAALASVFGVKVKDIWGP